MPQPGHPITTLLRRLLHLMHWQRICTQKRNPIQTLDGIPMPHHSMAYFLAQSKNGCGWKSISQVLLPLANSPHPAQDLVKVRPPIVCMMILPSRVHVYVLALVVFATAFVSTSSAEATGSHAPVWDPMMLSSRHHAVVTERNGMHRLDSSFSLTLYNIGDEMYYIKLRVGSPPQPVRVSFDTAASDFAVLATKHQGHMHFNDSKSSTFQADGRPVKLRDRTTGILSRDRVELHDGAAVEAQYFTEINNVTALEPYYKDLRFDGWLGLAPRVTQSVGDVPTLLESLFASHVVENPLIGISMPKGENGHVSFGSFDKQVTEGAMTYIDQPHPGLWTHSFDRIQVGDVDVPLSSSTHDVAITPIDTLQRVSNSSRTEAIEARMSLSFGVLDNTEPFIVGPPRAVWAIARAVHAKPHVLPNTWVVPCAAPMPSITFWHGEHPFTVTANEMVGYQVSKDECMVMMRSWSDDETRLGDWSFGLPVFHRYFFGFGFETTRRLGYALHPQS